MMVMTLCYIISIAFQLAGALILIWRFWGKTEKKVVDGCFGESNYAERNENGKVLLTKDKLRKSASNIFLNRIACIYIVAGYLSGVYGGLEDEIRIIALILIIVLSGFLIGIGSVISTIIARIKYPKNKPVDSDEIDVDIFTEITTDEIDEWFDSDNDSGLTQ